MAALVTSLPMPLPCTCTWVVKHIYYPMYMCSLYRLSIAKTFLPGNVLVTSNHVRNFCKQSYVSMYGPDNGVAAVFSTIPNFLIQSVHLFLWEGHVYVKSARIMPTPIN